MTDRRSAVLLFVVVFIAYAYFFGGGGWNQNSQFDLTRAIVERQTLSIDAYRGNTYDVSFNAGHTYSNKAPGVSFLAAIPYALIYGVERAANVDVNAPSVMTLNAWLCTVFTCGVCGALIPVVLFLYGRRIGVSAAAAMAIALVIAFGTYIFAYSTVLVAHVPSALFLLLAFTMTDVVTGFSPSHDGLKPVATFLAGACAGLAGIINYVCIPAALIILLARRRRLLFLAGAAPFAMLLLAYQHFAFGSAFSTSISTMSNVFVAKGAALGIFVKPRLDVLYAITLSRFRGLFYLSPVLVFAIVPKRRFALIGAIVLLFLLVNMSFNGWDGGSAIGPRYLLPIVPLLAIPMFFATSMLRPLWYVLATISIVVNFAVTAVNPMPSRTIADPIGRYTFPLLLTGHLPPDTPAYPPLAWKRMPGHVSVNRHSIDQFVPFMLHAEGSPESEWASFNAGEVVAEGSPLSLVPVALWICGGGALLLRRAYNQTA